jgi:hypothetical protein
VGSAEKKLFPSLFEHPHASLSGNSIVPLPKVYPIYFDLSSELYPVFFIDFPSPSNCASFPSLPYESSLSTREFEENWI